MPVLFRFPIDTAVGEFGGDANCVLDRIGVRRSVRDEADAVHAEQRSAAVFGVVETLFEIGEGAAREQVSDLPGDRGFQSFSESGAHQVGDAFGGFQRYVAYKSVGDDDVHLAAVEVASFDVADKIQREAASDSWKDSRGQLVALALFFADGEQARRADASCRTCCESRSRP